MRIFWICVVLFFCLSFDQVVFADDDGLDIAPADSLYRHDPYDISSVAVVDTTDVYVTKVNHLLRLPRYAWMSLVHPLGQFTIYAEHAKLWVRYFEFFTNKDGTFGIFPQVQLGGETGTGGGARFFHTNVFGRRKITTGHYVYSGNRGQFGEGLYVDPNVGGRGLIWQIRGGYLQTRHEDANVNGALDDDATRLFELKQIDAETVLEWRFQRGKMAPFIPQLSVAGKVGYAYRDLVPVRGGFGLLTDPGSSPQARLVKGLGSDYRYYRFGLSVTYDSRDFKKPVEELTHPPNYRFPGRVVAQFEDQFYFLRDVGYPERGGRIFVAGDVVTGPDDVQYLQMRAELSRYVTLFWKDRILAVRARLDKVRRFGNGFVPYTELVQLGGNTSMRGYERGYFRGQGALQFNVEYRYPIWDYWNAFLFWDEGQIFDHFADISRDGFHSSWGGGIAFRTEVGLLAKIKVGHSEAEKLLIGFAVAQDF